MANLLSLNGKVVGGGAGGSGGGHAIENSSGATLTQRDTLQFAGLNATDDSTNAKTVVDVFQDAMSLEDFEDAQNLGEGIYPITSDDSTVITADMVDYNGGTVSDVLDNIAPVETSTTSSQAYAIGEQFILNGTLYTATAAITAGGTITIGGNCTASDTVTEQISKLYAIVTNITFSNGLGSYALNGVTSSSVALVQRCQGTGSHDMLITASCDTNQVKLAAYRTASQTAFTGTVSVNLLVYI